MHWLVQSITSLKILKVRILFFLGQLAACFTGYLPEQGLVQCLISIVMRWTNSDPPPTSIPIKNQMHEIIGFSLGHLGKITPDTTFHAYTNYLAYVDEPLIILYLRCLLRNSPGFDLGV